mgnify:FL=1
MDRLQALEVFMLVAKLGSFTAASKATNLTASRVTHLIQSLEKELGVSLFIRTTRRVTLSSAGRTLFEQLEPQLGFISETLQNIKELSAEEPKGTIRIGAPVKFGSTFLMKPITEFLKKYPDVRIVLNTTNDPQEIFKDGSDIAFVLTTDLPLSGVRHKLGIFNSGIYANLSGMGELPYLQSPDQLSDELLVLQEGNASAWNLTSIEGQRYKVSAKRWAFKTDTTQAALIAAKEGLGLALLPIPLGESEESLTRLLPNWTGVPVEVCAITSSRKISSAARNFIDLAKEEFNKEK